MRLRRLGMIFVCSLSLTACGAGGVLGLNPKPDGNIIVSNPASGATMVTSSASPFIAASGGFSVGITEDRFSGPYTVTVTTWSAPFNIPCFVPHYLNTKTQTNIVRFTADNAAPITAITQPSPCNAYVVNGQTEYDQEMAEIADNDGHVVNFYYKLNTATGAATLRATPEKEQSRH